MTSFRGMEMHKDYLLCCSDDPAAFCERVSEQRQLSANRQTANEEELSLKVCYWSWREGTVDI